MTNLSVSLNSRFPNVFQSQSFTVVDQSDGFNFLPQLWENERKGMSVER